MAGQGALSAGSWAWPPSSPLSPAPLQYRSWFSSKHALNFKLLSAGLGTLHNPAPEHLLPFLHHWHLRGRVSYSPTVMAVCVFPLLESPSPFSNRDVAQVSQSTPCPPTHGAGITHSTCTLT